MPRVIPHAETAAAGLDEVLAVLDETGFHPEDEGNLQASARLLARLGNNPDFLGDMLVAELAENHREEQGGNAYGAQSLMLSPPGNGNWFLRANIWPSRDEHAFRASGGTPFVYDLPHDHNFHFLTQGYFGPGYWSDYYEYDYAEVTGWSGEPVDLRFVERARLEPGKVMLYRAHRDVHRQIPPDSLSVSINIMHCSGAQGWLDQYAFDLDQGRLTRILSNGSSEAFVRIAVALGSEEASDLAHRFLRQHPSDRMRLACLGALAAAAPDAAARDAAWAAGERAGSRLVAAEARRRRAEPKAKRDQFGSFGMG